MKNSRNTKKLINLYMYILYILCISIVSYHHECWEDEADPWLGMQVSFKDIGSQLVYYAKYSGHPTLWHFLLFTIQKLGFTSYEWQKVLHLIIVASYSFYLLFRTKLPLILSTLILFSYPFGYEWAVIARNYSLGVLFLLITANNFNNRKEKPAWFYIPLIISMYTNLYASLIAGCIFLFSLYEDFIYKIEADSYYKSLTLKNKNFRYLFSKFINVLTSKYPLIVIIFMILLVVLMFPNSDVQRAVGNRLKTSILIIIIQNLMMILYPMYEIHHSYIIYLFLSLLLSISSLIIISKNEKSYLFFYIFTFLTVMLFAIFGHSTGPRHLSHLFLVAIIFIIFLYNRKLTKINNKLLLTFTIPIIFSIFYTFSFYYLDYKYPFSNSKLIAKKINSISTKDTIYTDFGLYTISIIPYANTHKFFYTCENRLGGHIFWDKATYKECTNNEIYQKLKRKISKNSYIYYISTKQIKKRTFNKNIFRLDLLAKENKMSFSERAKKENYYLYKISLK